MELALSNNFALVRVSEKTPQRTEEKLSVQGKNLLRSFFGGEREGAKASVIDETNASSFSFQSVSDCPFLGVEFSFGYWELYPSTLKEQNGSSELVSFVQPLFKTKIYCCYWRGYVHRKSGK